VGFQLLSERTAQPGAGIVAFSIQTLTLNATSYQPESGTSMASPEVAGLATMLRAYNPQYTYADTVNAIKNGGKVRHPLAGKTATGRRSMSCRRWRTSIRHRPDGYRAIGGGMRCWRRRQRID